MTGRNKMLNHLRILVITVFTVAFFFQAAGGTPAGTSGAQNNPELYYLEHVSPNTTSWIMIEPVPNHYWGDSFTIIATTNLPVDQPIQLWGVPKEAIKDAPHNFGLISQHGFIGVRCTNFPGNPLYNITSCPVDTADLQFPNMNYSITAYPGYSPGNISSLILQPRWVIVNSIGNQTVGDIISINGTTNVPAGTNLSIYVEAPLCGRMKWQSDCTYGTVYANAKKSTSNPDIRTFSAALNTTGFRGSSFYDVYVSGTGLEGNHTPFRLIDPSYTESTDPKSNIRPVCVYYGPHGTELRECTEIPTESPPVTTVTSPAGIYPVFISAGMIAAFQRIRKGR